MVQAAQSLAEGGVPSSPRTQTTGKGMSFARVPSAVQEDDGDRTPVESRSNTTYGPNSTDVNERTPLVRPDSPVSQGSHGSAAGGHNGHSHGSMNMHALLLHVFGDALGNIGVIATGLVIWLTEWSFKYYFDPVISLVITVIIFSSALPLGMLYTYVVTTVANLSS
jgi:solute carrier family 30 (zinc transporter), member 1